MVSLRCLVLFVLVSQNRKPLLAVWDSTLSLLRCLIFGVQKNREKKSAWKTLHKYFLKYRLYRIFSFKKTSHEFVARNAQHPSLHGNSPCFFHHNPDANGSSHILTFRIGRMIHLGTTWGSHGRILGSFKWWFTPCLNLKIRTVVYTGKQKISSISSIKQNKNSCSMAHISSL